MFSVIIPNYNGLQLLKKNLGQIVSVLKSEEITDIIIVDDASSDDSFTYIKENYPAINLIKNTQNQGFGVSCNKGAAVAKESILLFLNTDMLPQRINRTEIQRHFKDKNLFALSPKIERKDKSGTIINESLTTGYFKGGWFSSEVNPNYSNSLLESGFPVLWACGGACFIDKKKFDQIGGFDPIYRPFYFEDLDLSYRAWKQNWNVLYTSKSSFYHQHQGTIGSLFTKQQIDRIHLSHEYLFMWKNLTDLSFLISHSVTVLIKILTIQVRDIRAILRAIKHFPDIIKYRCSIQSKRTDDSVLSQWSSFYNK
ncbi:hypothetical protein DID75_05435 [Candidatus Marinamargulisbacteria bacterium SCGC AG-410-N11]|nr:hypothetical protein DID75_05435 [Candidatus Marinamargulisbacteria bacterium SCGC AG-410-N11]